MLSDNIKKEANPKKKQDVKMLAIAAIAVLLMIGVLFWLFSGSSSSKNSENIQINTSKVETSAEKVIPKPPALNQQALEMINDTASVSNTNPFETNLAEEKEVVDITESMVENSVDSPNKEAMVLQNKQEEFSVEVKNIEQPFDNNINRVNKSTQYSSYADMKDYINSIKKDIRLSSNSFEYNNNIYKKGDFFNSLEIVDISNIFIRFSNGDWEYTLRFVGDR